MFAEAPVVKDIQEEGAQVLIDYMTHTIYLVFLKLSILRLFFNIHFTFYGVKYS